MQENRRNRREGSDTVVPSEPYIPLRKNVLPIFVDSAFYYGKFIFVQRSFHR